MHFAYFPSLFKKIEISVFFTSYLNEILQLLVLNIYLCSTTALSLKIEIGCQVELMIES